MITHTIILCFNLIEMKNFGLVKPKSVNSIFSNDGH